MAEFMFVLKSLIFTCILVFALQFEVGNQTIERRVFTWIRNSETSLFLKQTALGGVKVTQDAIHKAKGQLIEMSSDPKSFDSNKAQK
ncbi:MAG: hypothetical protein ACLGGX_00450 [Bdellovibrionia bacterium]